MSELDITLAGVLHLHLREAGLIPQGTQEPAALWTHLSPICQSQLIFLLGLRESGAKVALSDVLSLCHDDPLGWLMHRSAFEELGLSGPPTTPPVTPDDAPDTADVMSGWVMQLDAENGERCLEEGDFSWGGTVWDGELWPHLAAQAQDWTRNHSVQMALPEDLLVDLWTCAELVLGAEGEAVSLLHWHDGQQHAALVLSGHQGRSVVLVRTLNQPEDVMWTQLTSPAQEAVKRTVGSRNPGPLEWSRPHDGMLRAFVGRDEAVIGSLSRHLPRHWTLTPGLIRAEIQLLRQDDLASHSLA